MIIFSIGLIILISAFIMSFVTGSELFATIGDVNFSINGSDAYFSQNAESLMREINEMHDKFVVQPTKQSTLSSPFTGKKPAKPANPAKRAKPAKRAGKNTVKRAGKKGQRPKKIEPEQILEKAGLYNHKPARGRGRRIQLKSMTSEQILAEEKAKLEKNRESARQCRLRKKEYVESLEQRATYLQKENEKLKSLLSSLGM